MDLKIGSLTFDARPIGYWEMPDLLYRAIGKFKTDSVRNWYDCRDGGTFGKKKRLTIRANVIVVPHGTLHDWGSPQRTFGEPRKAKIKDTVASSTKLLRWMQDATGLSQGDALDSAIEKMFGANPKLPIPYDAIVAAHPGYSLHIISKLEYQFIALTHPKMAGFMQAMVVIAIPVGVGNYVTYEGKCTEDGYEKFGVAKRNLHRGTEFFAKPPATEEEARMRRAVLQWEIDRSKEREKELREEREKLQQRKAALGED